MSDQPCQGEQGTRRGWQLEPDPFPRQFCTAFLQMQKVKAEGVSTFTVLPGFHKSVL